MSKAIRKAIARIQDERNRVVGSGFLVDYQHLVTCAHVVNQALGRHLEMSEQPPDEARISLDFPFVARDETYLASIIEWRLSHTESFGDIALLELDSKAPESVQPVSLISAEDLWDHTFRAFGFPTGYDNGVWASGRVLDRDASGWLMIEDVDQTGYFVTPGFSGTPVWDDTLQGVIGMVAAADTTPGVRAAFIIPSETLLRKDIRTTPKPANIFICYKSDANPDKRLAVLLKKCLTARGHHVFIDRSIRAGEVWLEKIDKEIKASDYLVVMLSEASARSQMVHGEIHRAYEYQKLQGHPQILPIRVAYESLLPYPIAAFLNPLQYIIWEEEKHDIKICDEIIIAIEGHLPDKAPVKLHHDGIITLSEDGQPIHESDRIHPPLSEFDPRFLEQLEEPGGAVKLRDILYVKRNADQLFQKEINKSGTTTTIRAPRQSGKSSLLVRGLDYARQQGSHVIHLDVQRVARDFLIDMDGFLRYIAEYILRRLRLDIDQLEYFWRGSLGSQDKLTYLIEDYILAETEKSIFFAMDEVDRLLQVDFSTDFFSLLRSWHETRARNSLWDQFNIVMVISTEPDMLIENRHLSPFNVGKRIYLNDFNEDQVDDLNRRHGSPPPVAKRDIPQLMKLLGGHPYLTRKALYILTVEGKTWWEIEQIAVNDHGPFGDHLRHYHQILRDYPDLRNALKQVIRHQSCSDNFAILRLLRAGLVYSEGDIYRCRCDLYRRYFEDKL